ncbi:MAG: hypothetical protein EBZ58_11935 [Bacteroidetes bacterium]|nr:hypothetical protein [Bacteroidota bacterium]
MANHDKYAKYNEFDDFEFIDEVVLAEEFDKDYDPSEFNVSKDQRRAMGIGIDPNSDISFKDQKSLERIADENLDEENPSVIEDLVLKDLIDNGLAQKNEKPAED